MSKQQVQVNIVMDAALLTTLKRMARAESVLRDRNISVTELVRQTLSEKYPPEIDRQAASVPA